MSNRRFRKIGLTVYQRVLDASPDGHVDIIDVQAAIERELRAGGDLADDALEELAELAAKAADDELTKQTTSRQRSLLSGDDEALDGVWPLGDGKRVRARFATRDDYAQRMALKSQNFAAVAQAHADAQAEYSKLLPYFTTAATTVEEAIKAWREDNGGDDS